MADFWDVYLWPTGLIVAQILAIVLPLLVAVAYLTLAERKVIAAMQMRKGPNVVGPFGLLQPLADGLKLLMTEPIVPAGANRVVFLIAPMLTRSEEHTYALPSLMRTAYSVFCLNKNNTDIVINAIN